MSNHITAVGIDPGSSDKGVACVEVIVNRSEVSWELDTLDVFDRVSPTQLKKKLAGRKPSETSEDSTLLVWDAPLTGPSIPETESGGSNDWRHTFTIRKIEQHLKKLCKEKESVPGISVRDHHGCPHWAIAMARGRFPSSWLL